MTDAHLVSAPGRTLAEKVYETIKADLLSGELAAGSALLTRDLLERYGSGISPLREALARLVGEQLLEATGHRGVRVPLFSADDLEDIYRIRIALEREALELAMKRGDDEWEGAILAAGHRLEKAPLPETAGDTRLAVTAWEARHRAFHTSLISAAPAPRLLRLIAQMVDQTERYRALRLAFGDQGKLSRDIVSEHRALMEAVIGRDPTAPDLLARHLDRTCRMVASMLRKAGTRGGRG
ncbi:transcriptional regulator, GntR family [Rhizobiales bacterium GAS113]|jgi:GntR family carbon starvation induced transcriptional regulator|nr:transcriptional regulator, GntR family [Rhizobiales bacterium GAS113]